VSATGQVIKSEIDGALKMKSFLSGMPELKLGLNDKIVMESRGRDLAKGKSVEMEDIRFHQCVRLSQFENDRTISFIPPDGDFTLMEYRLATQVRPLIWIEAHIEPHSRSRVEFLVKAKSNFKRRSTASNVEIILPVPSDADTPTFKTSIGHVDYVPERDAIIWRIKQMPGQKEFLMRAGFGLPSISSMDDGQVTTVPTLSALTKKRPIAVNFEIPYFTVSGIQVRYLKIIEKTNYHASPWVSWSALSHADAFCFVQHGLLLIPFLFIIFAFLAFNNHLTTEKVRYATIAGEYHIRMT